jgi:hypothetical protein
MSDPRFLYHQKIKDSDCCVYDLEEWPCTVALLLNEVSDYITDRAAHHAEFQREGMEYAAELIRPAKEA